MYQTRLTEISQLREIVSHIVREEPIRPDVVQAARNTLQALCQEAAEYGLSTADVVRAVLRPVFEWERVCECPACKSRRNESGEEKPQPVSVPVI